MMVFVRISVLILSGLIFWGCTDDDPSESASKDTSSPSDSTDTDEGTDSLSGSDCDVTTGGFVENLDNCTPAQTDYIPSNSANDSWPACISDDNTYHLVATTPSSIARVEAYDSVSKLLWNNPKVPTAQNFIDSRILIDADQGIGSRLDRRYDVHYEPPPSGAACDEKGVAAQYPDYCVGPGKLRPILNKAFAAVSKGADTIVNAARIHAALQWFLYVSAIKEATTCTKTAKDCDSSWAYYSGGKPRNSVIGLAAEIKKFAPQTQNRAYDGTLAVRCWRFLDNSETATNLNMRDQAISQLDDALLYGMSVLIIKRFEKIKCATGSYREAALAELKILIPLFDLETRKRSAAVADMLKLEITKTADKIDVDKAIQGLESIYLCP
jgi:hypothetical protein